MNKSEMHSLARNLRKNQTEAEQILWSKLRSRQLSGFKFRRQHPIESYVLDFYCSETHLAIEIDGGQHTENKNIERDNDRTAYLNQKGIRVIRFWNNDVIKHLDEVLTEIDVILSEIVTEKEKD
jgi:very-short-patch-repair endonuclease